MINEAAVEAALSTYLVSIGFRPVPVVWLPDLRAGYEATWATNGSAVEMAAKRLDPPSPLPGVDDGSGGLGDDERGARQAAWTRVKAEKNSASLANFTAWSARERAASASRLRRLAPFEAASRAGLWMFWLMGDKVLAVPPPIVKRENDRLHSETGPAVRWPGGSPESSHYFWRGTEVPAEWIERKDAVDPTVALTWPNVEQRRAAMEIVGWSRIIDKLGSRVVDSHPNPMVGTLLEVDLPNAPGEKFLKVLCGTGRTFALCVPRECRTAIEAQTSTWPGLTQDEVLAALMKGNRA